MNPYQRFPSLAALYPASTQTTQQIAVLAIPELSGDQKNADALLRIKTGNFITNGLIHPGKSLVNLTQ